MEKHKKFKGPAKPPVSIDGFTVSNRRLGAPIANTFNKPDAEHSAAKLGRFDSREEGFHPLQQSSLNSGKNANNVMPDEHAEEPILLEETTKPVKKRRWLPSFGHPSKKTVIKRTALALLAVVVLGGIYFAAKIYITEKHLFRGGGNSAALSSNVDINQLKGEGDGRVNVLLLGIGGPGHDGPDLTDTIMIASIDPVNNKVTLLSIPRDLWVKIPGNGVQKINSAYPDGKYESKAKTLAGQEQDGLKLLDQTLEPVIGVNINYHVVVDFSAFKDLVDNLGGVTVNVPDELYDPTIAWENNYNPVIAKPGIQTFNGAKALLYAKSRETSSDFARAERQRLLMVAIKEKVFSLGTFSNPVKISNLLNSLGNNVFTDFGSNEIPRVYQIFKQIPSNSFTSLDLVTPPNQLVTTGDIDGLSVVEPLAGLNDYTDIQTFVRTNLRDGFLAKENAKVAVYNATDVAGAATTEAATLKEYGYNVTTVTNAPTVTNPATTTVVDLSHGVDKYTSHYLSERFKTTVRSSMPAATGITPPVGTNFVIILGEDVANSSQN